MSDPPKKPLGKAIHWTEEDLDRLSRVTDTDVDHAVQVWRDTAPPEYRDLLDAATEEENA